MLEVERKFLVKSTDYKNDAKTQTRIVQGFLNTDPERTVRVRIKGDKGFLTIKGKGNDSGTTRFEWEEEISFSDATDLVDLCEAVIVEKIRYEIPLGKHVYEVDEFLGENKGLVIAEIELLHEDEFFNKPAWLGTEVTGVIKYYNSQLSNHPYNTWDNTYKGS
jgi:CYTH domain-containing protein